MRGGAWTTQLGLVVGSDGGEERGPVGTPAQSDTVRVRYRTTRSEGGELQ
jgi:hypothetical protein